MDFQFEFFHAYMICFFVGSLYAVISAVLSGLLGGDFGHHDLDMSGGHDFDMSGADLDSGMVHFSPLSPTVIATFLATFGGTGMICLKVFNMSNYTSIPVSIIAAIGVASFVFFLFQWVFSKTQASLNIDAARLVGTHADVITAIPESGLGEIAFVCSGTRQNAAARAVDGKAIACPNEVEIVRVVGSSFLVRRVDSTESSAQTPVPPNE